MMDRFVILCNGQRPKEFVCERAVDYDFFYDSLMDLLYDNPYLGVMNMKFSECDPDRRVK